MNYLRYQGHLYRQAKVTPIDEDFVQSWRKSFLVLMRNLEKVHDYATAVEFGQVARKYADNFNEVFFTRFMNHDFRYDPELGKSEYWNKELRKAGWDFYIEAMSPPIQRADDYWKPEQRYYQYTKLVDKWSNGLKRRARKLWTTLRDFVASAGVRTVETLDETLHSIDGFAVQIRGYGQGGMEEYHPRWLGVAEEGFRRFRKRATSMFPWIVKHMLPVVLRFDITLDQRGEYHGGRYIEMYMASFHSRSEDDPDLFVKTLAHEMGHHVWKQYLSGISQEFWTKAVRNDYDDVLDLQYVVDHWPSSKALSLYSAAEQFLKRGEVDIYLQLMGLMWNARYKSFFEALPDKNAVQAYIDKNGPLMYVPKHSITAYANKNTEEAFCESLGLWIAYGERALYPIVRHWFDTILPEANIRTARSLR